jgi:hypothetical protein
MNFCIEARELTGCDYNRQKHFRHKFAPFPSLTLGHSALDRTCTEKSNERTKTNGCGEPMRVRARVFDDKEKLVERRDWDRSDDVFEFREAKHGDELFDGNHNSLSIDKSISSEIRKISAEHTTAVTNPRRSARLSTTSMNPNRRSPNTNEIHPT